MPRFCTRCGMSNDDAARFCKDCGAKLAEQGAAATAPTIEAAQARSGIAPRRNGGSMTQTGVQGEGAAPVAGSHASSGEVQGAGADIEHPASDAQHEQAQLAIAAKIKVQDKARAAALAAARISVVPDIKRSQRASLLSAPMPKQETASPATSAKGVVDEDGTSATAPTMGTRAQRKRTMLPVAGIATLAIAGGAYWWMHMHQTAVTHESAYAPVAAKTPPEPALQNAASGAPAAPAVVALAPHRTQSTGLTTAPDGATQRVQKHTAPRAMQRETPVVQRQREETQPKPRERSHAVARPRMHQRQSEGRAPVATPQQVVQQPSPLAQGLQARVDALRNGLSACQTKSNFFVQQLCIQRVRWKYCGAPLSPNPLWGRTPECPDSKQNRANP